MPAKTITSITIYWDNQDPSNEGWAYRIEYRGGQESSGSVDAVTLEYAIEGVIHEHDLTIAATEFAVSNSEGGYAHWVGVMVGDDLRDEIAQAVEDAGVCCPEQVCDACLAVAAAGGIWELELSKALQNDTGERRALGF